MTLHKLTAGEGYTYLTRQVAAHDATTRGFDDLGSYYSEKGESPGVWMGRGLDAVPEFSVAGQVTEAQMKSLFGEGRHPNGEQIVADATARGLSSREANQLAKLGKAYLIHDAANMFQRRTAGAFRDYNTAQGLHADTPVPEDVRADIRSRIATTMFVETFGREPADARELSGHLARISRQATTAVAGYDLSFSPVKSVSTLWAIAPREIAQVIETAHHDAVKDTLTWIEDNATYTRTGAGGIAQVDVRGLIAAAFTHRDSRAGDPDLHTHVAISNKVQTLDGRWLALDGRPIFKNNVPASERYNTRLEALLIERLGVQFADRADADGTDAADTGKRAVREIVGIDGDLPRSWSSRRAAIDVHRAQLSAKFQADHGRPPTPKEAVALAQQANLATRQRKHEPRSYAEQRATWRAEAVAVLGGGAEGESRLHYFVRDALRGGPRRSSNSNAEPTAASANQRRAHRVSRQGSTRRAEPTQVTPHWVQQCAEQVLTTVSNERATWQANHVRAEAERVVRSAGVRYRDLDAAVDQIVANALDPTRSILLDERDPITAAGADPAKLRRADGSSVFTVAGAARYTSAEIIAAEEAIVAAGGRRDGRTLDTSVLDMALLESTANGVTLNPGQVQLVRELATSGARVQLALAPAGTGKTTAMRVLSHAWTASGGVVIGLAPSAGAAAVLREEIGTDTDTLAKLIHHLRGGEGEAPSWLHQIGPDTLVVIDEAGMAGTPHLAEAIEHITAQGASVRLIGDDQQLAAIGAGGALRDLAHEHGAVTLSQVMRFTDPTTSTPNHAEGAASLALRDGDPAAIAYYLDHGRVHVGDLTTVTEDAYAAWSADRARGADPIMLAPTRDLVTELNERARTDRLRSLAERTGTSVAEVTGREAQLTGGARASAGDTIITRKNNRRIRISATDWVKNGDRWQVDAVNDNGSLSVTHVASNRHVTLPARYVRTRVQLGYASTVHGAQGITADTCYTVATGDESRQLLYVAMTRGRHANHVYLTTAGDGDQHSVITRDALLPPTAGDILARVLARDASPMSATSQRRELTRADVMLEATAARYHYLLNRAAEDHLGPDRLAIIDAAAETAVAGISHAEAYPALRSHLALLSLDGHDPADVLTAAIATSRGLSDARDPAAVLDWRLAPSGKHAAAPGPLPWLTGIPQALADDPQWSTALRDRADLVHQYRTDLAGQARSWTPTSAPTWAATLVDRTSKDPELLADLAIWRAAHAVEDTDRRLTGPNQPSSAEARTQRLLDQRVTRVLGDPDAATAKWKPLADSIDARISADPYWPTLADRLTAVDRAGINAAALTVDAAGGNPLPDEQPAAALWWRLAGHLSPAAMTANDHSEADTLRPAWTPDLIEVVGEPAAARIMADPAWPALVAAVTAATTPDSTTERGSSAPAHGAPAWEPQQILALSYDLLQGGQPDDEPLRPGELATALVWRIAVLTDPTAAPAPAAEDLAAVFEPAPEPEPAPTFDETTQPGGVGDVDEDWLASVIEGDQPAPFDEDYDAGDPDADSDPHHETAGHHLGEQAVADGEIGDWADGVFPTPDATLIDAWERAEQQKADAAHLHEHFWATAEVPRERLVELNQLAEDFFTRHYADTWAADYTRERLGTDLRDDPRAVVGYAPNNWTALTNHLRRHGATDAEIIGAGLGTRARNGNVVDRFRDRLVFPIKTVNPDTTSDSGTTTVRDTEHRVETVGFIARRNPARIDEDNAGPKYLNTADTDLFTKGHALYGLADNIAALQAGATPVVVEGPMDALAVTLAGTNPDGSVAYVGVAPLGTAFTDTQADALRPYISTRDHQPTVTRSDSLAEPARRSPIVVATDNDRAGQQAAHRAFWQLVARGEDPRHLVVAHGKDPAELLHSDGPAALRAGLESATPLADQVIADRTAPFADRLDSIEGRVQAARRAADVIGALPATTWLERANTAAEQFGLTPATVINDVLDRGHDWTTDPRALARQRLAERLPEPVRPPAPASEPAARWSELATKLDPKLVDDPHWPTLADHLTRADDTGYDVANRLTVLAAQRPLDAQHRARDLDLRLVSDWPGCLPPSDPAALRDTQDHRDRAAAQRLAVADQDAARRGLGRASTGPAPRPAVGPTTPGAPPPAGPNQQRQQPGRERGPSR